MRRKEPSGISIVGTLLAAATYVDAQIQFVDVSDAASGEVLDELDGVILEFD